ncbi:MAG: hypothetical protein IPP71_09505 [Bacteroidetes bacterium]|nr:hypothetical protein [Bacteroidota bacterium]
MVTVNPGIYFAELMPQYFRAAKICEVVYDNIDRLYKPMHDQGSLVSSIVTLGGDEGIIKCRCLLGYYKPTLMSHEEQAMAIEEFNTLLKTNAIHPHNYTASEVSDAEHFYSSTIMTMVPLLGLILNPVGTWAWDFIKPSVTTIYSSGKETIFGEQK